MGRILVTGGTGVLGRALVPRLVGDDVRVLTRDPARVASSGGGGGPVFVPGDLDTGDGLAAAVTGVDVIVHCASSSDPRRPERDVQGTRRLLGAVSGDPHIVYISVVGADRIPLRYHRAKAAAEHVVEASRLPWTILRTTQFHELVLSVLATLARAPVALCPAGFQVQPVDAGEVADRLAAIAAGGPAGRVPELGGPRVEEVGELMTGYLRAVRRRRPVLPLPVPGRGAAAFRAGRHLTPQHRDGRRTFGEFLLDSVRTDGTVTLPYELTRRR